MSILSYKKEWRREKYMRNIIFKRLIRLRNKNLYRKEKFPYDMRAAIKYAESVGKRVYQLSDTEMKTFLL